MRVMTLKMRSDAKNALRCSPANDVPDTATESVDDVADVDHASVATSATSVVTRHGIRIMHFRISGRIYPVSDYPKSGSVGNCPHLNHPKIRGF
ncbi:unnamed protein product [Heligmosomoides polygyrus]|uniref:DUF4278 domain-containing protein n=1 Tax=Heligmosomoides polygyrus TaxID=6339 RepID=A0A183G8B4_HELPZ|nr:unnamed protein product [Heligmosomoides polygyrus]